jgi:glycosyltransferase involved in cell wall biosynthesis
MGDPLVTCVCPTWNRPAYLVHAVKLFLAQTYRRAELVILDDSDDQHRAAVPRSLNIRHVQLPQRLTIGAKHNLAHKMGQGDVFCYWDDDDWFNPRRLVRQLEPIILQTAELVGFRRNYIMSTGYPGGWWKAKELSIDPKLWIGNGAVNLKVYMHDGSAMYTRAAAARSKPHPDQTMNEKVAFLNGLVESGTVSKTITNDDLMVYVRHGKNTWKYDEKLVHAPAGVPTWFPRSELEFYRRVPA